MARKPIFCKDTWETAFTYSEYLKTRHWKSIRTKVIQDRGKVCEVCGRSNIPLQVHHMTYERIGCEKMEDLICVCKDCHMGIHSTMPTGWEYKLISERRKQKLQRRKRKRKRKRKTYAGKTSS